MSTLLMKPETHAADTGGVGLSANAFAEIYREHMPELTRYCRSIVRDGHDAEDAAQAAMERAFKALSDAPAPDRVRPWLFTIAQRESINVLRRRAKAAPVELDKATLVSTEGSPEELSAVRERLAELLSDLQELAPRQRELLVARELGGRSYKELAHQYGTTEAAAQQVVLEARQSLVQFESGRSLECDSVQRWISTRDHHRVRTRRVRAHLRACHGCRGFQHGIRARRRDFSLLLPGLGGGAAWWSSLAALLGQGGAKAVTAGAVVATGVALVGVAPMIGGGDVPPLRQDFPVAQATPVATPFPAALTSRLFGAAGAAPAARAERRAGGRRTTAGEGGRRATRTLPARSGGGAVPISQAEVAATPASDGGRSRPASRPASSPTPGGPSPSSTPSATAHPVAALPDVREVTEPVRNIVEDTAAAVEDVVGDVTEGVTPALPKPKLP